MELRHFRYFKAVAEELSFSEAAKKLFIAQPAISQQIADLENELGVKLLHRSKRQVLLTPAGNNFYKRISKILEDVEDSISIAQRTSKGQVGDLKIGFIGPPVLHFLPALIKRFREKFDGIRVSLVKMDPFEQLEALMNNEINIGFSRPFEKSFYPNLDSELVFTDSFAAVVPKTHAYAKSKSLTPEDLINEPLIIQSRTIMKNYYEMIMGFFHEFKQRPEIFNETDDVQALLTMVEAECGIGLVPSSVRGVTNCDSLVYIPLEPDSITTELCMNWRRDQEDIVTEAFVELARDSKVENKFSLV